MISKPTHLAPEYAAQFQDPSVVAAYRYRPPYPAEVFAILSALIEDEPRVVLDVGCGAGEVARELVAFVDRIDAVDRSLPMIERGRRLPNGDSPKLRWICAAVEEAALHSPYALITAGASLHWMDWDVVMPRFAQMLTPRGRLAIVEQDRHPVSWDADLSRIIPRFSTNRDYRPYDLIDELTIRGLFARQGARATVPMPFTQSVADFIESIHSRNGFSRERMSRRAARRFDGAVARLVTPDAPDGMLEFGIVGKVVWGKPLPVEMT